MVAPPSAPTFRPSVPFGPSLGVFFIVLLLCIITASGHLYSPDEEVMYRTTESLWSRGSLSIAPLVAGPDGDGFASRKGKDGGEYAQYGIGNSIAAGPMYAAGLLAKRFIDPATAEHWLRFKTVQYLPENVPAGPALLMRTAVSFTGALVAAATAALLFAFVRGLSAVTAYRCNIPVQNTPAWIASLCYATGTMAWPHARTFFSEPLAAFCILGAFYAAAFGSITVLRCAAIGAWMAAALLARLDSAIMLPGVGIVLLARYGQQLGIATFPSTRTAFQEAAQAVLGRPEFWLRLIALAAGPIAVAVWQLTFNALHFGGPFESAYADQKEGINFSTPITAGLYGFLFSIGRSIFLFSPVVVLGLLGWGRLSRWFPALAWGLGLSVLLKVGLHSTWQNWAGGWCWGPRHIFQVHVLIMLAAWGFVHGWNPVRKLLTAGLFLAGVYVQLLGCSQSFIDYYWLYYRTPAVPPSAMVLLSGEDAAVTSVLKVEMLDPRSGIFRPISPSYIPAPISDSIYVPQNSVWYRYPEMRRLGYTDNLWLRLRKIARDEERPVM